MGGRRAWAPFPVSLLEYFCERLGLEESDQTGGSAPLLLEIRERGRHGGGREGRDGTGTLSGGQAASMPVWGKGGQVKGAGAGDHARPGKGGSCCGLPGSQRQAPHWPRCGRSASAVLSPAPPSGGERYCF